MRVYRARDSYKPEARFSTWLFRIANNLASNMRRSAGRRKEAYRNFRRGLDLERGHRGIRTALKKMGVRRRPVLSFLARSHPLNVLLGRMRVAGQTR